MIDVERTIISQYGNSPTILQLVQNMNAYLDPRADFDAFFDYVWNVDTAQGFGLDIWGRIVNIRRELQIPDAPVYFGFNDALPGAYPFDEAPFYDGTAPATGTIPNLQAGRRCLPQVDFDKGACQHRVEQRPVVESTFAKYVCRPRPLLCQ